MKQRILYLDLLRIIACVMIVFMHSQCAGMGIPACFLSGSSYITAAGIGLFFIISGALILGKVMTFGVYLTHILVLRAGLWNVAALTSISGILYMIVCSTITILVALFVTRILCRIPYGKWVVEG